MLIEILSTSARTAFVFAISFKKITSAVRRCLQLTRKDLQLRLVSLVKRYVWSAQRTQNGVSRALFHPQIASESNFWPRLSLGAHLAPTTPENSGWFSGI